MSTMILAMCGRFAQISSAEELVELFGLKSRPHAVPNYNIAPTQSIMVIREHPNGRYANVCRWGLVPSWSEETGIGKRLFNARSETVFTKKSFFEPARKRGCVVPASGFYEWRETPDGKTPILAQPTNTKVFLFAGLWSTWMELSGAILYTATILTTEANAKMAPFHHRMPVLLDPGAVSLWLDVTISNPTTLVPLLKTAPDSALRLRPVSRRVNNVRHNDRQCWENPISSQ